MTLEALELISSQATQKSGRARPDFCVGNPYRRPEHPPRVTAFSGDT